MHGTINTERVVTPQTPFYSVGRLEHGEVIQCVRASRFSCRQCILRSCCVMYKAGHKDEIHGG